MPGIAPITFCRISGPYEYNDVFPTKASTAIDVGDALKENTGLAPATTDTEIVALALQAKASSVSAQTSILTMIILDRAKFYGVAEAGTFVRETDGAKAVDLNSADGLDADATTNKDWLVYQVLTTTEAIGKFTHLATTFR